MTKLIITRGLPASGKTTQAKAWVAEDPIHRARINRDDLRDMIHNGFWDGENTEKTIMRARNTLIATALKLGLDVVCDDTNLPQRTVRDLHRLATLNGASFEVWDLTNVPVETCIERDAQRTGEASVGEAIIRHLHMSIKNKSYPLPLPDESTTSYDDVAPYVPPIGDYIPETILVDIDGTVAHMCGRSPYDESRVHEDTPNQPVIDMVRRLSASGVDIIFCSGRSEICRTATEKWLEQHVGVEYLALYMRKVGDKRRDSIVKMEIFNKYIRLARLRVIGVFDDRNQVVEMWRSLGLTVFQVAPGDF